MNKRHFFPSWGIYLQSSPTTFWHLNFSWESANKLIFDEEYKKKKLFMSPKVQIWPHYQIDRSISSLELYLELIEPINILTFVRNHSLFHLKNPILFLAFKKNLGFRNNKRRVEPDEIYKFGLMLYVSVHAVLPILKQMKIK